MIGSDCTNAKVLGFADKQPYLILRLDHIKSSATTTAPNGTPMARKNTPEFSGLGAGSVGLGVSTCGAGV